MQGEHFARNELDKGRLPRPVRAEDRDVLAFMKRERIDRENRIARTNNNRLCEMQKRLRLSAMG